MNQYYKYLLMTFIIVALTAIVVILGNWLLGVGGVVVGFIIVIGLGIWYYQYDYNKNKCPYRD